MRACHSPWIVAALVACHDSSSSSPPFLALGVNDLGRMDAIHDFEDGILAFTMHETTEDLNGDGDQDDAFLAVLDVRSGTRELVAHVHMQVSTGAGFVSFLVSEAEAERDLDGDGDQLDLVAHVHDARRGSTRNLGLATSSAPVQEGAWIAVAAHEQPGIDWNGDGDFDDVVAHLYEADRDRLTSLASTASGAPIRIVGRRVLYLGQPGPTVQIYDADTGQTRGLPHAIEELWVEGSLLATLVSEPANGHVDLNGNGSSDDRFVELRDLDTDRVRVTSEHDGDVLAIGADLAVLILPGDVRVYDRFTDTLSDPISESIIAGRDSVSDRRHAFLRPERTAGEDLDGNGELLDEVLHLFDARTGTARNTELPAYSEPQIDARRAAFLGLAEPTSERPPSRVSVHVLDLQTLGETNLGVMASALRLVGEHIVALTPEAWQGVDLDGDHSLADLVLQVHDLASGETLNTGLSLSAFGLDPILVDGDALALTYFGRLTVVRLR